MHLIFYVLGVFFNPATGDIQQVVAQVDSVTECVQIVNDTREVDPADQMGYTMVEARCGAIQEDDAGNIVPNQ